MKGAESLAGSLVADFQASVFPEPGHRAFDHIACLAQATTVRTPAHRQQAATASEQN